MHEEYPQATDVPMMFGNASMHASWPAALRDLLRAEAPNGVSVGDLWASLSQRDAIPQGDESHQRSFWNALDYLADVGLAKMANGLWYEIPLTRTRSAA